ncbi:hypothetical protein NBRC116599_36880 [Aquicoccus sp. SU-CL01552]
MYLQAWMEPQAECMLVILGATPEGKKELVGFQVGLRESAQSPLSENYYAIACRSAGRELLVDIKARGLAVPPEIAAGGGAMGFWKALDEFFPGTGHQRCWVHKIANVLIKLPKSMQLTVKVALREIWQAETRAKAMAAMDIFAEKYSAKYEKAVTCLTKDREVLLAFYGSPTVLASNCPPDSLPPAADRRELPGEHWDHLRTGNPIESVFATVRHRTVRTKGALSQKTAKLMVFKPVQAPSPIIPHSSLSFVADARQRECRAPLIFPNISSRCHRHRLERPRSIRRLRISAADNGPNLGHQNGPPHG